MNAPRDELNTAKIGRAAKHLDEIGANFVRHEVDLMGDATHQVMISAEPLDAAIRSRHDEMIPNWAMNRQGGITIKYRIEV